MKTTRNLLCAAAVVALVSLACAKSAEAQVRISTPGFGLATGSGGTAVRVGGLGISAGPGVGISAGPSWGGYRPYSPSVYPRPYRPYPSYRPSYPSYRPWGGPPVYPGPRYPGFRPYGPRWP